MRTAEAVEMFIEDCRYRQLTDKTIDSYRWALKKLPDKLPDEQRDLKRIIANADLATESRHDMWRNFRAFFHWLALNHLADDAMLGIQAPRTQRRYPRTLEPSDIYRVLASAESRRDRAMIALTLDTGIRLNELAGLTWFDITATTAQVNGKGGRDRVVPISSTVLRTMTGLGDGVTIWKGKKGRLTRSGVQQAIRRSLYRAGYLPPKAGPHMLRHTFGKLYVMNGGDVFSLQRIMGHARLETTMIYVYMSSADLIRQHEQFSPMNIIDFTYNEANLTKEKAR